MMVIEPESVIGHRIRARNPIRLRQVLLALPGRFRMEVPLGRGQCRGAAFFA